MFFTLSVGLAAYWAWGQGAWLLNTVTKDKWWQTEGPLCLDIGGALSTYAWFLFHLLEEQVGK